MLRLPAFGYVRPAGLAEAAQALADHGSDAMVLAVPHRVFMERPLAELASKVTPGGCFIDVQSQVDRAALQALGLRVWRL